MSRSEQFGEKKSNPAQLTIEWAGAGDAGNLKTYDKESGKLQLGSLSFVVLEQRHCVDGYYAKENTGAWSNEIKELSEVLTVRWKKGDNGGVLAEGTYTDIKDKLAPLGIKYHKSIYIMVTESTDIEAGTVARLRLKGASSFEWSNFVKSGEAKGLITIDGFTDHQNGAIKYRTPTFKAGELGVEASEEAELAYEQVKAYFASRSVSVAPSVEPEPTDPSEVPF